ncbi:hypothetical protein CEXT_454831 [Caerostris extrusa]|uniref:Uncharacterized protein n=1 Tax=Caerostris extrusa TaxID=172846 RepID=A0AAV4USY3_CAEEX|nr:hypothetical protein CEXT_454831 [Caerostris extrusa]
MFSFECCICESCVSAQLLQNAVYLMLMLLANAVVLSLFMNGYVQPLNTTSSLPPQSSKQEFQPERKSLMRVQNPSLSGAEILFVSSGRLQFAHSNVDVT